jgi:hypothetical protein
MRRILLLRWMTASGHEERFLPPRKSAGCGFGKETFAGSRCNGEDAPREAIGPRCIIRASAV